MLRAVNFHIWHPLDPLPTPPTPQGEVALKTHVSWLPSGAQEVFCIAGQEVQMASFDFKREAEEVPEDDWNKESNEFRCPFR